MVVHTRGTKNEARMTDGRAFFVRFDILLCKTGRVESARGGQNMSWNTIFCYKPGRNNSLSAVQR